MRLAPPLLSLGLTGCLGRSRPELVEQVSTLETQNSELQTRLSEAVSTAQGHLEWSGLLGGVATALGGLAMVACFVGLFAMFFGRIKLAMFAFSIVGCSVGTVVFGGLFVYLNTKIIEFAPMIGLCLGLIVAGIIWVNRGKIEAKTGIDLPWTEPDYGKNQIRY